MSHFLSNVDESEEYRASFIQTTNNEWTQERDSDSKHPTRSEQTNKKNQRFKLITSFVLVRDATDGDTLYSRSSQYVVNQSLDDRQISNNLFSGAIRKRIFSGSFF